MNKTALRWVLLLLGLSVFPLGEVYAQKVQSEKPPGTFPLPSLNVVYNNISIGASPIWIMHHAGIFQKHGLEVALSFARGTLATQAMVAGSFPVGFVSPSSVVSSNLAGSRLKIVAGLLNKMLYALVTSRDINSPSQLKGKRVGISRLGDASETATRFAAKEIGLDPDREFTVVQVGNSPERFAALRAGAIQGMMADPADLIRARREGFNVLIDLTTKGIDYQGSTVTMSEEFIRDHSDKTLSFVRALVEGIHYFKNNREATLRVAAGYLKTTDLDALGQAWQVFAERIVPIKPYPSVKGMQLVIREVASRNPAARDAIPEQFFDTRFIEQIDKSGFINRLYK